MAFWCFLVTLFYVCANAISNPVTPCKITDVKCFEKSGLFSKFIQGDPTIGTENLDPMHLNVIDGNLSTLKYKLTDSNLTGLKDCKIENLKLNSTTLWLHSDMLCPSLKMCGNYDMHRRIMALPVEGTGDYCITSKTYRIAHDMELKLVQGKDGKSYVALKNFRLKPKPLEPVLYEFKNLFNGQKELAEPVNKHMNENWEQVVNEMQDTNFEAIFKKIHKNINKFLKSMIDTGFVSTLD